jgi:hypothetical protein
MAKQIAKLLKATIEDTSDLKKIAKDLAKKGRGGDSMLAHITPKEAEMLKSAGGSGTINPDTGLLEFYDWSGAPDYSDASTYTARTSPDTTFSDYDPSVRTATFGTPEFDYGNASYAYTPTRPVVDESFRGFQPQVETFGMPTPFSRSNVISQQDPNYFYPRTAESGEDVSARASSSFDASALGFDPYQGGYSTVPVTAPAEKGYLEKLKEKLGNTQFLERLGLAGIGAIPGIYMASQARKEGRRAREEMEKLAAPYQTEGKRLLEQAQRGELTAPAQQQISALQARAAQGVAARGGVGAEQAAAQVEAFRQQLLSNQYDLGLKVSGIGDQIATGAIRTGLQADQYVNQLTASYYGNLFRDIGGLNQPVVQQTQQQPR